jgi:1,4-dihydroxy-2-naphthoyl-CoA hydrolase
MTTENDSALAPLLNQDPGGWVKAMGLSFVKASADEVEVEWTVGKEHLQPYGIVHGGVHCGVIETVCSVGAALSVASRGDTRGAVGLENHTSFIRAVREGAKLRCRATPITRGRTTQVWQAEVREGDQIVATGRLRLLVVDPATQLSGGR